MGEGSGVPTPLLKGGPSDLLQVGSRVAMKPWPRVAEYHSSIKGTLKRWEAEGNGNKIEGKTRIRYRIRIKEKQSDSEVKKLSNWISNRNGIDMNTCRVTLLLRIKNVIKSIKEIQKNIMQQQKVVTWFFKLTDDTIACTSLKSA